MFAPLARPLLPLLALLAMGCPKKSSSSWADGIPSPQKAASSQPPQYDEGTIGLQGTVSGSPEDEGEIWSWTSGGGDPVEGYLIDHMDHYTTAYPQEATESSDSPGGSQSAFDDLRVMSGGSPVVCSGTDQSCMAKWTYTYGSVPAASTFPTTTPTGASLKVVDLLNTTTNPCDGGTPVTAHQAWIYRVQVLDAGQRKWLEMWFMGSSWTPPNHCQSGSAIQVVAHHNLETASPPSPRTFVNQLNGTSCSGTPEPWCQACDSGAGHSCTYTRVVLDWVQKK